MAEIATIARPYAEALFKASGQDAASAAAWLDALADVAANEQLRQFADNPKTTAQQVFDLIAGVLKAPLPAAGQNFLRTVIDNGRLAALPEIAEQFRALKNAQQGTLTRTCSAPSRSSPQPWPIFPACSRSASAASSTCRSSSSPS